ncbi:hypothetical protein FC99_GL000012 [Levilactobacillus koreensis JCM 16448]|uniref:Uncharacterized protein n=1 Tax=Levilactobacillus koreensis TaxID=637971 RepID=A0AAC8ZGD2_9LACO|nr:hypothetical protein [Levilactobacillus koreensis]AKP64408.1 hypothetical protein ABN16_04940 [Levilactobacillus koreensis]KRK90456.1 hypothetical protein FC99_GL000012 [Levilactobacillus koreensis JCM 16448]
MELIIIIAVIGIAVTIGKKYWEWIVGIPLIIILLQMFGAHPIIMLVVAAIVGIWLYQNSDSNQEKKREQQFNKWVSQDVESNYDYTQISNYMDDMGKAMPFSGDEVPLGRAEFFASSFKHLFFDGDTVYGYYPVRSEIDSELREYGLVITNRGIGMAIQSVENKNSKDQKSDVKSTEILFSGLWFISFDEENNKVTVRSQSKQIEISLGGYNLLNAEALVSDVQNLIDSGFTRDLYTGKIDSQAEDEFKNDLVRFEEVEHQPEELSDQRKKLFDEYSEETSKKLDIDGDAAAIRTGLGAQAGNISAHNLHNIQINQMVNGRQGHGVAAEYANSVMDGGYLTNSRLVGQDNAKHGADRLSFGKKVQVKTSIRLDSKGQYIGKNTADSIKLAFAGGEYQYGSMPTEVPKDQYNKSVQYMKDQIIKGNVEGITDPNQASSMVKKGKFNGEYYANVAKAGTVESLKVDTLNAIEQSIPGAGITFLMTYSIAIWRGANQKEAARMAGKSAFKAGLDSTKFILFTTQAAKIKMVKKFAASKVGKSIGMKESAEDIGKYVGSVAVVAITFGPSIVNALRGRISTAQLTKDSVIGGVSIAASVALGPAGLVVGGIGAAITGYFTKKIMDEFIEDDAKEMYQVFKEEFLDIVMASGLSDEEYQEVLDKTFQNKKFSSWLKDMFAADDRRGYARTVLVGGAVSDVMSERKKISDEEVIEAYETAQDEFAMA